MAVTSVKKIIVLSDGLAGHLCAAKLQSVLADSIDLILVESKRPNETDILYGTVTSPSTYDFLLSLDLAEPDILQHSNTAFSLGTEYKNWGPNAQNWMQSFHLPLPMFQGVHFHHYLTRVKQIKSQSASLEDYIMSVQAAKAGVFAHPTEDRKTPLSDVQYGYQFLPQDWCKMISQKIQASRFMRLSGDVTSVEHDGDHIQSLTLSDGQTLTADFFIDTLGRASKLGAQRQTLTGSNFKIASSTLESTEMGKPYRSVSGKSYGWQADTPLQTGGHRFTFFRPNEEKAAMQDHGSSEASILDVDFGRLDNPWDGNCLALGLGAEIVDPVTPAPMILLQRDIERLAELIPLNSDMTIESREYNRGFHADHANAALFREALLLGTEKDNAESADSKTARRVKSSKLEAKISQFESRGTLVQYDYEPFSHEDWIMLHYGRERRPKRYDRLADHIPLDQLEHRLEQMRGAIKIMTKKIPSHQTYMSGLLKYLKDKHG